MISSARKTPLKNKILIGVIALIIVSSLVQVLALRFGIILGNQEIVNGTIIDISYENKTSLGIGATTRTKKTWFHTDISFINNQGYTSTLTVLTTRKGFDYPVEDLGFKVGDTVQVKYTLDKPSTAHAVGNTFR